MKWLGSTGQIITVGSLMYSRGREYSVFDMRYLAKGPVCTKKLDNLDHHAQIHYDEGTKLFFVANKKDATCQYYFYSDGGANQDLDSSSRYEHDTNPSLIPLSSFEGQSDCQGMSFIPRRCIEKEDGELVRALRFNGK